MENRIIEVENLSREYKVTTGFFNRHKKVVKALKNINFEVYQGEIFGLLGPNGAGKSTTINILSTLLAPSSGSAKVLGLNTFGEEKKLREKINFIRGGERCLYWRLSALDNLRYFSDIYKIPKEVQKKRIPLLLDIVGLQNHANDKVETFSKGMKQKLQIARGLINDPEVLFLDEPTIGLDPVSARDFRSLVMSLKERGKTIILTTHYMNDVEALCNRIAIIKNGELLTCDTISRLRDSSIGYKIVEFDLIRNISTEEIEDLSKKYNCQKSIISTRDNKDVLTLHVKNSEIVFALQEEIKDMGRISVRDSNLEDLYIKLVE